MGLDLVTNQEVIVAARKSLPQEVWDYLTGGSESETTMRRNRLGFDSLALRRQLDHGQATIDVLPEVVEAASGKAEVILDGGVMRGTDVLKAIALGAKAVTIGKLQGWGLAAGGAAGLVRVLEILEEEIVTDMGLLGVATIGQVGRGHVCAAPPVTLPHEMSAFLHVPGGRLV